MWPGIASNVSGIKMQLHNVMKWLHFKRGCIESTVDNLTVMSIKGWMESYGYCGWSGYWFTYSSHCWSIHGYLGPVRSACDTMVPGTNYGCLTIRWTMAATNDLEGPFVVICGSPIKGTQTICYLHNYSCTHSHNYMYTLVDVIGLIIICQSIYLLGRLFHIG